MQAKNKDNQSLVSMFWSTGDPVSVDVNVRRKYKRKRILFEIVYFYFF